MLPWEFSETSKTISTAISLGEFIDQLLLRVISFQEKEQAVWFLEETKNRTQNSYLQKDLYIDVSCIMITYLFLVTFLVSSFEDFLFASFQQKNEKREIPWQSSYLHFCSSIDLFDVKDFKRNLTDGHLIRKCV